MDGFQRHVGPSLQTRLSAWLGLAIVVGAVAAGASAYYAAFNDAIELQDDQLRQVAALITQYDQPGSGFSFAGNAGSSDPEAQLVVETLPDSKDAFVQTGPLAGLEGGLPDGLQSVRPGKLGWRIAVTSLPSGARLAVGQRAAVRGELARNNARQAVLPLLLLIPILIVVGHLIVRRTFKPIDAVAAGLDQRSDDDFRAMVDDGLPAEIRPFMLAINRMLVRLDHVMAIQRRFVADAAHELRSPLTALSLQAERLRDSDMSAQAQERLATLRQGIRRSQNLVGQLLDLARAQHQPVASPQFASVQKVFREVLEDLMPLADLKQIDIGVAGRDEVVLAVSEMDLSTLVKNLVDNAIRYTPHHGRIDLAVRIEGSNAVLQVSDTGPGIPQHEHARVFEPFYRTLGSDETGSGLGLSIVKAIADRIHAQIRLCESDAIGHNGLLVEVLVPVKRSPERAKK